jgi:UV DNA damage endonuclease
MRLGFAVKVLGREGTEKQRLASLAELAAPARFDEYVNTIFDYLDETKISMYRISSDSRRISHHSRHAAVSQPVGRSTRRPRSTRQARAEMNLRLSFHPSHYILLNSPNEKLTQTSIRDINAQGHHSRHHGAG